MELALRPVSTAGVALVGASIIAVTPVAPPLPDIQVSAPAVQLSAATSGLNLLDPLGALAGTGGAGGSVITDLTTAADGLLGGILNPGGDLSSLGGLASGLDLGALLSSPDSIESSIQTTLINAILALETTLNNGIATLLGAIATPIESLGTTLSNLATTISDLGGAFGPIGGIVDNFASSVNLLGELLTLAPLILPEFTQPLFDIPVQLVNFGSALVDLVTGAPAASDLAAGVSGVSAQPDVSALLSVGGIDSAIQTLLINFLGTNGLVDTIGQAFFDDSGFLGTVIAAPFTFVGTSLDAVDTFISSIGSPVLDPIGAIFGDLGDFTSLTGALAALVPDVLYFTAEPLIFGNFEQLVLLGSALIPGGGAAAADLSVGSGLATDLSALDPGLAADLSTPLNPADFATLFDPAAISSLVGGLAADLGAMLPALIP